MLNNSEKRDIIGVVSDYTRNKMPVFVGTTGSNTTESIAMTKFTYECGAYGAVMVVPSYIRPPQEDIYNFFKKISSVVDTPIAVYNNPARVRVKLTLKLLFV